jgi:AIPR protein
MPTPRLSEHDLKRELHDLRDLYPKLGDDDLFVLWFLRAFVTDDDDAAVKGLCGGSGDKSVDAVFIDEQSRIVFVVQGKYRQKLFKKAENRTDVESFAHLGCAICGEAAEFADLIEGLAPEVARRVEAARDRVRKRGYRLQLTFVSTGRFSPAVAEAATRIVRSAGKLAGIQLLDGKQVLLMLADYLDGVAPPVPSLDLEIESRRGVAGSSVLQRYDPGTRIESWVFSISDQTVADLFQRAGVRLFARNVRGFLGSTDINRGMQETLAREPEHFWYYNNGITIICDQAERLGSGGRDVLRVTNPQVINGQQTTRTLASASSGTARASVLVRVIRVPREHGRPAAPFETLVSNIVSATNWQNAIRPSDLRSNDRTQIEIDRQLRKLGYFYLRKRQRKSEARRAMGGHHLHMVRKEELAQAVAACDHDPAVVREGKERLFEERWYRQIFPHGAADFYLNRYWLMRQVGHTAHGYPERAYAKWLVLNFAWPRLAPFVRSAEGRRQFWSSCLRNNQEVTRPLRRALDALFTAAIRFYRKRRGTGATAQDISTFFQKRGLHTGFATYWASGANKSKPAFKRSWAVFERVMKEATDPQV